MRRIISIASILCISLSVNIIGMDKTEMQENLSSLDPEILTVILNYNLFLEKEALIKKYTSTYDIFTFYRDLNQFQKEVSQILLKLRLTDKRFNLIVNKNFIDEVKNEIHQILSIKENNENPISRKDLVAKIKYNLDEDEYHPQNVDKDLLQKIVKLLLASNDTNLINKYKAKLLETASSNDKHKDTVIVLINLGADVNIQYPNPLARAVRRNAKEIVKLLINKGADVNYNEPPAYPFLV